MSKRLIRIAHSPDTDDIFMFWALKTGRLTHPDFEFEITGCDIEELNRAANDEIYDITALSIHAYAHLADKYALTASGASMAEGTYGPLLVARSDFPLTELAGKTVAVPGEGTTAFLLLKLAAPQFRYRVMTPTEILKAVVNGEVDAGLIIHEGQIQSEHLGLRVLHRVIDTWKTIAGDLPLPLGGSAVKKSLGLNVMRALSELQQKSILFALEHRDMAVRYCLDVNPVLSKIDADRYLSWYVNDRTVDLGTEGKRALDLLFTTAHERGLIPHSVTTEII